MNFIWLTVVYGISSFEKLKLSYCFPFFSVYSRFYFSQIARYFSKNKATTNLKNNLRFISKQFLNLLG